jgi:hypothetical protein
VRTPLAGIALALAAASARADDVAAARADFALHGTQARYLSLAAVPAADREAALAVLAFWLPHLSRKSVLERQRPTPLPGTLVRIDLDDLGWGRAAWEKVSAEYPYTFDLQSPESVPAASLHPSTLVLRHSPLDLLVVRADWLLRVTADATASTLYYDLLYAGLAPPRNKADFLAAWKLDRADAEGLEAGVVVDEGKSGVAFRTRLLVWRPAAAGSWWETFDSRQGAGRNDPLENLAGGLAYDAQELIVSIPKFSLATGERGIAQAYLLVNGKGERVDEAPTDIVLDRQRLLGLPAIRTPGSCVLCHQAVNGPAENLVRQLVPAGVELSARRRATQEFLERFYLSDLGRTVARNNEDFATFCRLACGREPAAAVAAWRTVVEAYDRPLDLDQAAREVGAAPQELQAALAWHSDRQGPEAGAGRVSALAHGRSVPRRVFEETVFRQCCEALCAWRKR